MSHSQPDPEWRPIARPQLEDIIRTEELLFDDERRAMWNRYRVPLAEASILRAPDWGLEKVFVVARNGSRVLYFDDVEYEFAFGDLSSDSLLTFIGFVGDLRYA